MNSLLHKIYLIILSNCISSILMKAIEHYCNTETGEMLNDTEEIHT